MCFCFAYKDQGFHKLLPHYHMVTVLFDANYPSEYDINFFSRKHSSYKNREKNSTEADLKNLQAWHGKIDSVICCLLVERSKRFFFEILPRKRRRKISWGSLNCCRTNHNMDVVSSKLSHCLHKSIQWHLSAIYQIDVKRRWLHHRHKSNLMNLHELTVVVLRRFDKMRKNVAM